MKVVTKKVIEREQKNKTKKNTFKCCQKNNEEKGKRGALFQIVPQIEEVDN